METIKQTFTFNHAIADLKLELKLLREDLKTAEDILDAELDFETGNKNTLTSQVDKIAEIESKIKKKDKMLVNLILALSN